jgi:hypothetical protein
MTALFILAEQHRALAERLTDLDLDDQTIADTLEAEAGELEAKATATAMVVRNMEAAAAAMKEAEASIAKRRKAAEARADKLRAYLLDNLHRAGIKRVDHPMLSLAIKGKAASVVILDEAQLPAEFMDQPPPPAPKPSKTRIGAAIKAGQEVPGAKLGDDTVRLEIA